jgi:thiamine biosynthesis protein ThiS
LKLRINGDELDVVDNLSVTELVKHLKLTPERIAIELNQRVIRRTDWHSIVLKDEDRLEIVHFVGGGAGKPAYPRGGEAQGEAFLFAYNQV